MHLERSSVGLTYDLVPFKNQKLYYDEQFAINDQHFVFNEADKKEWADTVKSVMAEQCETDPEFKAFLETNPHFLQGNTVRPFEQSLDPEILFLGTASMVPSKSKNASGIYMIHRGYGILMDCAEGSYNQLRDHFADQALLDECLLKTKVVFLTHIHGDHQLGVLKILYERDKLFDADDDNKIYVVTPQPMMEWM